jgi:hypothetical protein
VLITNLAHSFNVFISLLYMFRATQCSSSGESIVSVHLLVYITPCRWPSGMQVRGTNCTEMHGQQNIKSFGGLRDFKLSACHPEVFTDT